MLRSLLAICLLILAPAGAARAQDSAYTTDATHAVILDFETGQILFSKNGDEPMPPASMSKLMTVYMAFEAIRDGRLSLDDELPVSEEAWRRGGAATGGSTMFLEPNTRARVGDLLRGIIVQSGNDACIVIAEGLEGTESNFADAMTERAHQLGLTSANFENATGWPHPDHEISAADLARLAALIIEEFPELYEIYSETDFTYNGIRQFNRNPLLGVVEGADGLKTGHTEESGYGLVGSAERDGTRRVTVFNGMESGRARADEAERIMRAAFTEFEIVELVQAGEVLGQADVFMGTASVVDLRAGEALTVGVHRRERADLTAEIVFEGPLRAPVLEGDPVGQLVVTFPGGRTETVPVEAAESVPGKGMAGRAVSALVHLIRGN
ncbi:D-alanyl-D-alanine carboxypeptidase [Marinicauda pacifica]|uniref:serine-type D-Ala-D-Ala carboxypeptidase n=1 Tax=Marinicauda pacifica TaxID=1133559 RepID=A0A4S2HEM1_9PROT|nr:D-alanyl-D-alanine carboxypeptidase family protein [Marinicauda pacifica]TGY94504.1 D-alanyl-D-alanine carboxypeptidase [Marinicauda pacifica]GGE36392.1 D-alanyl-D-alanine carboxypeptidase [Marinicauda pacifica]